jgi:hypothetical protein
LFDETKVLDCRGVGMGAGLILKESEKVRAEALKSCPLR